MALALVFYVDQPVCIDLIKDGWHMTAYNGNDVDLAPGFTGGQTGNIMRGCRS